MQTQDLEAPIATFLAYPTQPCLLLVSPDVVCLEMAVESLAATHRWPMLTLGKALSAALLHEAPVRWGTATVRWLDDIVRQMMPGPLLVSRIDLLFDPDLHLDPLRLFCQVGRRMPLIVAWPGSYARDVLMYAVPEHAHYREWRRPDAIIVQV
ncbi:MAG: BREX-3 system P-loop-containing protein BrxF [Anaerolineae bacterium]|nr:BREX-3 system P-loop-containing protein BrxF [Anaerolineae bacterium]